MQCLVSDGGHDRPTKAEQTETTSEDARERQLLAQIEHLKNALTERETQIAERDRVIEEAKNEYEIDQRKILELTKERDDAMELVSEAFSQKTLLPTGKTINCSCTE